MITLSNVNTKHVAIISEFIEHEQDEFERQDDNFHEDHNEYSNSAFNDQNDDFQLPDSPIIQLLKSNVILSLDINLIFENWEEVELFMDTYSEQQGFENKKVRVEKDKYGQIKKRRFDCEHSGKHKPMKIPIIENQRNSTSKKLNVAFG